MITYKRSDSFSGTVKIRVQPQELRYELRILVVILRGLREGLQSESYILMHRSKIHY